MSEVGIDWLKKRGIHDPAVLKAMGEVKHADFLDNGETAHAPEIAAKMVQAMGLKDAGTVLHVGTGSGYISAILSRLATSVFSVEKDQDQAKLAAKRLAELGFKNVQVLYGNTLKQYAANAPYDGILVSASMKELPQKLAKRLGNQGSLVAPLIQGSGVQLVRMKRYTDTSFKEEYLGELTVKPLLGDILVEMGVVDRHEVEMAAMEADVKGKKLGEALLEGHYVQEGDIYQALAKQNDMKLWSAEQVLRHMDKQFVQSMPRAFMSHNRIIPVMKHQGVLQVVTSDPYAQAHELAAALNLVTIDLGLISPTDYEIVWSALDRKEPQPEVDLGAPAPSKQAAPKFDAETISFFEALLNQAIERRASDVHFERHEGEVRVRFRIDGDLHPQSFELNAERLGGIVNLVKVSGRMDQAERTRPQQGHFQRRLADRIYDVRARTQITQFGETVTLRILPQDHRVQTLEELGFPETSADRLRHLCDRRSGLILVVGPSGSGRSTSMYATIGHVAENVTRKVISVENPVTYSLANVYQIKVDPRAGFGVAAALTSVMGDDADAILIGDIDNAELAHTAVKASRAGHLVIGVITGRDTIDGVRALTEFGVPSDTVASELIAVVGQRLAKRLCPACKTETSLSDELSEAMNWEDGKAFKSKGCEVCEGRGTRGRIAVTEFLEVSHRLRSEISKGNGIDALRNVAQEDGVTTLQMSAQRLVAGGIIPQEELRWTPSWTR